MKPWNHTPGPWHSGGCTIYAGSYRVAQTWDAEYDGMPTHQMEADAGLISAAPELLTALEMAVEWLEAAQADQPDDWKDPAMDAAVESARAAIAKAKGGPQ